MSTTGPDPDDVIHAFALAAKLDEAPRYYANDYARELATRLRAHARNITASDRTWVAYRLRTAIRAAEVELDKIDEYVARCPVAPDGSEAP